MPGRFHYLVSFAASRLCVEIFTLDVVVAAGELARSPSLLSRACSARCHSRYSRSQPSLSARPQGGRSALHGVGGIAQLASRAPRASTSPRFRPWRCSPPGTAAGTAGSRCIPPRSRCASAWRRRRWRPQDRLRCTACSLCMSTHLCMQLVTLLREPRSYMKATSYKPQAASYTFHLKLWLGAHLKLEAWSSTRRARRRTLAPAPGRGRPARCRAAPGSRPRLLFPARPPRS
jgi:hypothetical protein